MLAAVEAEHFKVVQLDRVGQAAVALLVRQEVITREHREPL